MGDSSSVCVAQKEDEVCCELHEGGGEWGNYMRVGENGVFT